MGMNVAGIPRYGSERRRIPTGMDIIKAETPREWSAVVVTPTKNMRV